MKIGIDARIYPTGIWRYSTNLLKELAEVAAPDDEFIVFLRKPGFEAFKEPDHRFKKVLADYPPYSFVEQILFLWLLWKHNCDLIHFTNFNAPIFWPKKFVITIHDLIHQSHSTFGSTTRNYYYYLLKRWVYRFAIRLLALRASRVIVPSKSTQDDLQQHLGTDPKKIRVTYEGIDSELLTNEPVKVEDDQRVLALYGISQPYLLYVATMYPHKNHRMLIEAFLKLHEKRTSTTLVLVGKVDHFSTQIRQELEEKNITSVIFPNFACPDGYVPDEHLKVLYRNAHVYVFPSLKEGFGIPLLEAQTYRLPVVASNIPCLIEVGGDSALYFDPKSVSQIIEALEKVFDNEELRQSLRQKGESNITRFSWKTMAKQTYDVYKEVVR